MSSLPRITLLLTLKFDPQPYSTPSSWTSKNPQIWCSHETYCILCLLPYIYQLSKYLSSFFECITNFNSQYSLHNSIELIDEITDVKFPSNAILVSFDVVGLFPSVPLLDTIKCIKDTLLDAHVSTLIIDEFMKLLSLCLFSNFCKFEDKIFSLLDGVPMGSPLLLPWLLRY